MEAEIPPAKIPILAKVSLILFGVFASSLIFAFSIKLFQDFGLWIGLTISALIIFLGFYYSRPNSRLRMITWSLFCTVVIGTIVYFAGIIFISTNLDKILT